MNKESFDSYSANIVVNSGSLPLQGQTATHQWGHHLFTCRPQSTDRLNQGSFEIEQDEGWRTILMTTPSDKPIKNFGMGLMGYTMEENGPSIAARRGEESLEEHVEKMASLPFVDVLYIRCNWFDVQTRPGKLDLSPLWKLTLDAAKRHDLRVAFRVQLSNPAIQPQRLSIPEFLRDRIPVVNIGNATGKFRIDSSLLEPKYDHPEFQKAFRELNELLADEFDGNPLIEFMDLMMYGFWGEGHTGNLPNPMLNYLTAEKIFTEMTQLQIDTWKKTPIAVNTQPDISRVGNRAVQELAVRSGCWLRSDSVMDEEPIQVEMLTNRPPWLAVVMEDGCFRRYDVNGNYLFSDEAGINILEKLMLHLPDLGANYWSLWTEADNLKSYYEKYPASIDNLRRKIGYRIRPSWVWQRKRYETDELVVAFANDGAAGVPGVLRVYVETMEGKVIAGGSLDAGHPYGGRTRQASFLLPRGMDGQKVKMFAFMETRGGVCRPVTWACAQPLNDDGSLTLQLKRHDEEGWRKGI